MAHTVRLHRTTPAASSLRASSRIQWRGTGNAWSCQSPERRRHMRDHRSTSSSSSDQPRRRRRRQPAANQQPPPPQPPPPRQSPPPPLPLQTRRLHWPHRWRCQAMLAPPPPPRRPPPLVPFDRRPRRHCRCQPPPRQPALSVLLLLPLPLPLPPLLLPPPLCLAADKRAQSRLKPSFTSQ